MRDFIKDENYFNCFISEELSRINKFENKLGAGDVKEDRILPVKTKIHDLRRGVLIARYSLGEDIDDLKGDFLKLIDEWEEVLEPEYYNKNVQMLSLAVLFCVNSDAKQKIVKIMKKANVKDWLYDFLLSALEGKEANYDNSLLFPETYDILQKIVDEVHNVDLLKQYLISEWYGEDCGCYEAHKSTQNVYYGYWSFEAGAIAKIFKLDDSSLKEVKYYPYDLVHYVG